MNYSEGQTRAHLQGPLAHSHPSPNPIPIEARNYSRLKPGNLRSSIFLPACEWCDRLCVLSSGVQLPWGPAPLTSSVAWAQTKASDSSPVDQARHVLHRKPQSKHCFDGWSSLGLAGLCLPPLRSRVPVGAAAGVQKQADDAHGLRSKGQRTPS